LPSSLPGPCRTSAQTSPRARQRLFPWHAEGTRRGPPADLKARRSRTHNARRRCSPRRAASRTPRRPDNTMPAGVQDPGSSALRRWVLAVSSNRNSRQLFQDVFVGRNNLAGSSAPWLSEWNARLRWCRPHSGTEPAWAARRATALPSRGRFSRKLAVAVVPPYRTQTRPKPATNGTIPRDEAVPPEVALGNSSRITPLRQGYFSTVVSVRVQGSAVSGGAEPGSGSTTAASFPGLDRASQLA
jgi:hypothetical protein